MVGPEERGGGDADLEKGRAQEPASGGWRAFVAVVLIVIGCVLAPFAVVAVWSSNQISNTSRYVENVAPLAESPAVQEAVANRVTTEVTKRLNVEGLVTDTVNSFEQRGLPPAIGDRLEGFAASLSSAVAGFVHQTALRFVQSDTFKKLWTAANKVAHRQLVGVLSGNGSKVLQVQGSAVSIDLSSIIAEVKAKLVESGLKAASLIPEVNASLQIFQSQDLVKAQRAYQLANTLKWVLPILSLLLIVGGVFTARHRRSALIRAALGLAVAMLVLGLGILIGRTVFLDKVAAAGLNTAAASDLFDTLIRFLRDGLRLVLVLALLIAAVAYATSGSDRAVRSRAAVSRRLTSRAGGNRWVYENKTLLRVGVVALGILIFAFWDRPTGLVVIVLTVLVLIGLAVVEFLGGSEAAHAGGRAGSGSV